MRLALCLLLLAACGNKKLGESCASTAQCERGAVCGNGVCMRSLTGDNTASIDAQCPAAGCESSKLKKGDSCHQASECASGFCTDGVCCDGACDVGCEFCNSMGSVGTCTAPSDPKFDTSKPRVGNTCALAQGQTCGVDGDCASGHCVDGVCCNTGCGEACRSCASAGHVGTCTALTNQMDEPACQPTPAGLFRCDASGDCTIAQKRAGDPQSPLYFSARGGKAYMRGYSSSPDFDRELWVLDNNNTTSRISVLPGSNSGDPEQFASIGNDTYFFAHNSNYLYANSLWRTDGSVLGTFKVADLFSNYVTNCNDANVHDVTSVGGYIYFSANARIGGTCIGQELWRYGPNNGLQLVADIYAGNSSSDPSSFTTVGNKLYFYVNAGARGVYGLDASSTAIPTPQLLDFGSLVNQSGNQVIALGDRLITSGIQKVQGTLLVNGVEPAYYDTLDNTAAHITDLAPGINSSDPRSFVTIGDWAYFTANSVVDGIELFRTDGSITQRVTDIAPGTNSSYPQNLKAAGRVICFSATSAATGSEGYCHDPEANELISLGELAPSTNSAYPYGFEGIGNFVFFALPQGINNTELWVTDLKSKVTFRSCPLGQTCRGSNMTTIDGRMYMNYDDQPGIMGHLLTYPY